MTKTCNIRGRVRRSAARRTKRRSPRQHRRRLCAGARSGATIDGPHPRGFPGPGDRSADLGSRHCRARHRRRDGRCASVRRSRHRELFLSGVVADRERSGGCSLHDRRTPERAGDVSFPARRSRCGCRAAQPQSARHAHQRAGARDRRAIDAGGCLRPGARGDGEPQSDAGGQSRAAARHRGSASRRPRAAAARQRRYQTAADATSPFSPSR